MTLWNMKLILFWYALFYGGFRRNTLQSLLYRKCRGRDIALKEICWKYIYSLDSIRRNLTKLVPNARGSPPKILLALESKQQIKLCITKDFGSSLVEPSRRIFSTYSLDQVKEVDKTSRSTLPIFWHIKKTKSVKHVVF